MVRCLVAVCACLLLAVFSHAVSAAAKPNFLLITVDDMNADSVGVYGAAVPAITPNIDSLARSGLRFERAHVQVANCMPSRNVMWSGRYPQSNGVEGFTAVAKPGYPTLGDVLQREGYFAAIRHKLRDSTPYQPYPWDQVLDILPDGVKANRKDATSYGLSTAMGIRSAKAAGKPFYLLINIADPHLPFYGLDKAGNKVTDAFVPSRVYSATDIAVPGFLPDDPVIREELAHYYSSVRRADDAVGAVLRALDESGEAANTVVMLVSDHGMPFPFAKTQLYHRSTHVPLVWRWPGVTAAGAVDAVNMVSAVDFVPTLLEGIGAGMPEGLEGQSFFSLLKGDAQAGRTLVFKAYNENSAGQRAPMRAVQSPSWLYIFNPWSDGQRILRSATYHGSSFARMQELARDDTKLAARLHRLKYRAVEEFYDVRSDPDCLHNLIDEPALQPEIQAMAAALQKWMQATQDHALPAFVNRHKPQVLAAYMGEQERIAHERKEWKRLIRKAMKQRDAPLKIAE